jgi:hypothetical protein
MSGKKWPPPGFPIVEGDHALTAKWAVRLPEPFARRVEDGSPCLWRPGLTIWVAAWNNDRRQSQAERLRWVKEAASPDRFAESEASADGLTRYRYRLRDESEDGPAESVNGYVIADDGHLQLGIYFDDPADAERALKLVDCFTRRVPPEPGAAPDRRGM